jgi:glycosyltransferase involved in cell wall biosynthesis
MLDSVIAQTYQNWECLIIDDNSVDDTKNIVNKYIKHNHRLKYILKGKAINKGLPSSRNIGIREAKGEYLIFFDDDDIVHPQLLELCLNEFRKENFDFVHFKKQSFKENFDYELLKKITEYNAVKIEDALYEKVILGELPLASCTVMWKTELFKTNLFNEELMYAEEWECYSRLLILNKLKVAIIKQNLYFNRKHANSNTGEFWSNSDYRKKSYINAHKLILELLLKNNKLNNKLKNFFFHKAYTLKENSIVDVLLNKKIGNKITFFCFPIKYYLYKMIK